MNNPSCEACNDTGLINVTDCCFVEASSNGDSSTSDFGICPECKEQCTYGVPCEECETFNNNKNGTN